MRILNFIVPKEYDGVKLKSFLRGYCGISANLLTKLKQQPNGIRVNEEHQTVLVTLKVGNLVQLTVPEEGKMVAPTELPFPVCYEDEDFIVVDKPCNMPMYPTPGHDSDTLFNAAAFYFLNCGKSGSFRPIYRLDKDTSGLVVLAKNSYVAFKLSGCVEKVYFAVCEGILAGNGTVNSPIGVLPGHRVQRGVLADGKEAVTHWTALESAGGHTLLKIRIETGRTHQIRVHMASLGYPLAGDDMYGGRLDYIERQALHCGELSFLHPVNGEECVFFSSFPKDIKRLCLACGLQTLI